MSDSYFNQTAAAITATAAGNNTAAIAEIYKGHEHLSPLSMYSGAQPNIVFNATAMVVFFVYTVWQFILYMIYKNNFFAICMVLYLAGQAIGYLGRTLSASDITGLSLNNRVDFLVQTICLTLSPNFFNAAMYSQYGKVLFTYATTRNKIDKLNVFGGRVQPILLGVMLIASDIICLMIQGLGGGLEATSVNGSDGNSLKTGNRIFIMGLGLQTASMSFFFIVYIKLLYNIFIKQRVEYLNSTIDISRQQYTSYKSSFFTPWKWYGIYKKVKFEDMDTITYNIDTSRFSKNRKKLFDTYPFALFFAFGLAVIRCIYRLVELADNGFNGFLAKHEHYLVGLDFVPLSISSLIMCFYAEGVVFGKKGLLEVTLVKMSSYRGLTAWKSFKVEARHMLHMKVDHERLNMQFNEMVREKVKGDDLGMDFDDSNNMFDSSRRSDADSIIDVTSNLFLKESTFFKTSLAQKK